MTAGQGLIFAIIGAALVFFAWGRWRYDVVAVAALIVAVAVGVVPADRAFSGFGDAAVITVAAVLILTRSLQRAGTAERISALLGAVPGRAALQIGALTGAVAVLSAFMNNVGAMALMLPVALNAARRYDIPPSRMLMPIAFGSLLGGLTTLIGTPPNVIIASYRAAATGSPFGMFDYSPAGLGVALIGIAFIATIGHRLLPSLGKGESAADKLFDIGDYVTEVNVPAEHPLIGKPLREIVVAADGDVSVVALFRGGQRQLAPPWFERLREGDTLMIEGDPESLTKAVDATRLELAGDREITSESLRSDDVVLAEAIVGPGSLLEGRTARGLRINSRYGINVLAVAREARQLHDRIGHIRFHPGDVLLVQAPGATMPETLSALGCLPLAERELSLGGRRSHVPLMIFGAAILATVFGIAPVHVAFVAAVLLIALLDAMPLREMYDAIDWPVVVLLGAMLPVGAALQTTGATDRIAGFITGLGAGAPAVVLIGIVMAVAMLLSAAVNNAATAVLMAPVAIGVANTLGVSVDPFLMAVAIGSSCAFLTPIGHQSNLLVMGPGGYHFGDYWRMGLPISLVVLFTATPLIVLIWPLGG